MTCFDGGVVSGDGGNGVVLTAFLMEEWRGLMVC
jgi:hypothetical protein